MFHLLQLQDHLLHQLQPGEPVHLHPLLTLVPALYRCAHPAPQLWRIPGQNPRGVQMVLAERGTGFALWKDQLDNLSCYAADKEDKLFHSLHYSRDHMVRVGISWE